MPAPIRLMVTEVTRGPKRSERPSDDAVALVPTGARSSGPATTEGATHETAPILDQPHPRRLLPSRDDGPGRGAASLLRRRAGTSRRPALRPDRLRDDGGSVAA